MRYTSGNWLAPHARINNATAWMVSNDTLYVRNDHAATEAVNVTFAFPGTINFPSKCVIVDTNLANSTGASESSTGTTQIAITGNVIIDGTAPGALILTGGSGVGNGGLVIGQTTSDKIICNYVDFIIGCTNVNSTISINNATLNKSELNNCRFKFSNASQGIRAFNAGEALIRGGSWLTGGTYPTSIFQCSGNGYTLQVSGVDFSNITATANIVLGGPSAGGGYINITNCKLPTTAGGGSWSGLLVSSPFTRPGIIIRMHNCDDGNTNYKIWEQDYTGTVKQETTIVRTNPIGATDGVTPISWKMNTTAGGNASYPVHFLKTPKIAIRNSVVGSSKTATIDIIHDSLTNLTNADIWIELEYLGNSSFPLSTFIKNQVANVLSSPSDQPASTSTWVTTGLTNPNKQKLSVTFTPQQKGYFLATVCLALVNKTVYVNPIVDVV